MRASGTLATTICLLATACALPTSRPPIPPSESEITQNRAAFAYWLRARDLTRATRFAIYFKGSAGPAHRLMAQYYLLTCKPRAAAREVAELENTQDRELFEGTLDALVSTELRARVTPTETTAPSPPLSTSLSKNKNFHGQHIILPVNREVWADEWPKIESGAEACRMPRVADATARNQFQTRARELLSKIPEETLRSEENLRLLAVSVGAIPQAAPPAPRPEAPVHVSEAHANSLELTDLRLELVQSAPYAIAIPILIGQKAGK